MVDGEAGVRRLLRVYLEIDGHRVVAATTGHEALERLRQFGASAFDLVIADHAMEDVSGFQVALAVKHLRQDLPVILLTGFVGVSVGEGASRVDAVLEKPVHLSALRGAIARLTSRGPGAEGAAS